MTLRVSKNENDTLLGQKIIVVYDLVKKNPSKMQTRGRHNAQYMTVEGTKERPATAIIDIRLHYVKDR